METKTSLPKGTPGTLCSENAGIPRTEKARKNASTGVYNPTGFIFDCRVTSIQSRRFFLVIRTAQVGEHLFAYKFYVQQYLHGRMNKLNSEIRTADVAEENQAIIRALNDAHDWLLTFASPQEVSTAIADINIKIRELQTVNLF